MSSLTGPLFSKWYPPFIKLYFVSSSQNMYHIRSQKWFHVFNFECVCICAHVWVAARLIILQHNIFLLPHSLKLECEKLASEKTEMQRHYVMVSLIDCECSHECISVFFFGVWRPVLTLPWSLFFFLFPVLRNVIRAEHRDAQAGRKMFFSPSYVKKKNWFKQDCSIEFCSISTVQSAVNMEIINLLPPVLQGYHWKEQTAFSRWQLWSLELKYFRFQNVPPCIAGPLVLYKMLFILNSALINTHVLLFLPPFTGIFTFLRWRDPRFWYYCVSNSWRLSCVSITFDR